MEEEKEAAQPFPHFFSPRCGLQRANIVCLFLPQTVTKCKPVCFASSGLFGINCNNYVPQLQELSERQCGVHKSRGDL